MLFRASQEVVGASRLASRTALPHPRGLKVYIEHYTRLEKSTNSSPHDLRHKYGLIHRTLVSSATPRFVGSRPQRPCIGIGFCESNGQVGFFRIPRCIQPLASRPIFWYGSGGNLSKGIRGGYKSYCFRITTPDFAE